MSDLTKGRGDGPIPQQATDRILLRDIPDVAIGQVVHGWIGDWPPPPQLVVVREIAPLPGRPPEFRVVDPREQDPGVLDAFRDHIAFVVEVYDRRSASEIDRPALAGEHWFRGAEYIRQQTPRRRT